MNKFLVLVKNPCCLFLPNLMVVKKGTYGEQHSKFFLSFFLFYTNTLYTQLWLLLITNLRNWARLKIKQCYKWTSKTQNLPIVYILFHRKSCDIDLHCSINISSTQLAIKVHNYPAYLTIITTTHESSSSSMKVTITHKK